MKLPIPTNIPLTTLNKYLGDVLDLSVRSANCLQNAGIECIWQLLTWNEVELLKLPYLGRKQLLEIRTLLEELHLQIGALHNCTLLLKGHTITPIDELFVYVPAERTPLTEGQVEYLRRPLEGAFPKSTRMNMWLGYTSCVTVFDLVMLIVHMQDDDTHVVRAFRTELEHVLGPLPLQLTVADLGRIREEKPERSYHV